MDCGAEGVEGVEGKRRGSEIPSQSRAAALGTREVTRGLAHEGGCLPQSTTFLTGRQPKIAAAVRETRAAAELNFEFLASGRTVFNQNTHRQASKSTRQWLSVTIGGGCGKKKGKTRFLNR